jgi:catechol-2,3-dioxygenase
MTEIRIKRLNHFTLPVRDLARATAFWSEVMGGQVVYESPPDQVAKGLARSRHAAIRLPHTPEDGPTVDLFQETHRADTSEWDGWFHPHYAFEVEAADFADLQRHLEHHGVPYDGPRTHARNGSASLYFEDTDGNHLEFYCVSGYEDMTIPLGAPDRTHLAHDWPNSRREATEPARTPAR